MTGSAAAVGDVVARVDGLRISYRAADRDVVVLDDLSLAVRRGETVGLVGESGSGKSTAARTLLGGLRPGSRVDAGSVEVLGHDVLALDRATLRDLRGRTVSLVAQNAGQALTPSMRIGAQVAEALTVHGLEASHERLVELMRLVRLPDPVEMLERWPHQLSGGQQQRVVLAMAVATDPALLVLDEPTTALDVVTQAAVLSLVEELQERLGMAVLIVSHDLGVVSAVADRIVVLHQGRTVESGLSAEVLGAPREDYTRRLLAAAPRVHASPPSHGAAPADDGGTDGRTVVRCRGLDVRYPGASRRAVSGFDLDVRRGETVAVVGESGSGKSTVAAVLAGLAPVESGSAVLTADADAAGSVDLLTPAARRSAEVRRQVQMIFQNAELALNPRRSVGDAVARPLKVFGRARGRAETRAAVERLLAEVGLDPAMARRVPGQLSGGQRQRVGIARALAAEPTLVVADEVTTALDVSVQAEVLDLLDEHRRTRSLSCLFISHDLAVVRRVAHRAVVMKDGWVVESGPVDALFSDPQHPYTRTLLDAVLEPGASTLPGSDVDAARPDLGGELFDLGGGHVVRRSETVGV